MSNIHRREGAQLPLTMEMSFRISLGEMWQESLLQMNSVRTGSGSPMYSEIFLLIQGPTLFVTRVCGKKVRGQHVGSEVKVSGEIKKVTLSIWSHLSWY